ncbi:hypothetical protein [Candidatus Frankia meridionalis]|uniref:hypothetical protein n=1 Tax=Protofrankia TaxID=2994361 RepID=UPI0005B82898
MSTSTHRAGSAIVRCPAWLFVGPTVNPTPRTRVTWRATRSVDADSSKSDQRSASASPRRRPTIASSTYSA